MLARAMEKDIKAQHDADIAEKNQLMAEAMNDPVFKNQLETLKTQTAIKKNNELLWVFSLHFRRVYKTFI